MKNPDSRGGLNTSIHKSLLGGQVNTIVNISLMSELEKLIEDDKEKSDPSDEIKEEAKAEPEIKSTEKTPEEIAKEEHLANLNKAIEVQSEELRRIRKEKKVVKSTDDDDDIPVINDEDPSAKAWNRRIRESVAPVQEQMERAQDEVRSSALREFLKDKPSLARDPEKVKRLVSRYEKIHEGTELNKDNAIEDFEAAYVSLDPKAILEAARSRRVNEAKAENMYSDIVVDSGTTTYRKERDVSSPQINEEDIPLILKMYGSVEEYKKTLKDHGQR